MSTLGIENTRSHSSGKGRKNQGDVLTMKMFSSKFRDSRKDSDKIQSLDGVMASQASAEGRPDAASTINGTDAAEKPQTKPDRSPAAVSSSIQALPKDDKEPLPSQKPEGSTSGVTFASQEHLPKLPIPDLGQTCQRYLEALEPLQNSREHKDTERAVHEFMRSEGPELDERLKKYADGKSSYIEQFCKSSHHSAWHQIFCKSRSAGR